MGSVGEVRKNRIVDDPPHDEQRRDVEPDDLTEPQRWEIEEGAVTEHQCARSPRTTPRDTIRRGRTAPCGHCTAAHFQPGRGNWKKHRMDGLQRFQHASLRLFALHNTPQHERRRCPVHAGRTPLGQLREQPHIYQYG
jgi:hypothetical protein